MRFEIDCCFESFFLLIQRDLLLGLVHEYYIGMGMIQQRRQGRPVPQVRGRMFLFPRTPKDLCDVEL